MTADNLTALPADLRRIAAAIGSAGLTRRNAKDEARWSQQLLEIADRIAASRAPAGAGVNPAFWIEVIRTNAHVTDCREKTTALTNAADNLERFALLAARDAESAALLRELRDYVVSEHERASLPRYREREQRLLDRIDAALQADTARAEGASDGR